MQLLFDRLTDHATRHGDQPCFVHLAHEQAPLTRTFAEVDHRSRVAAAWMRERGIDAGDPVVLIGTHDPGLYDIWLGAARLGAIPTILAEPAVRVDREVYAGRLTQLLARIEGHVVFRGADVELPALGDAAGPLDVLPFAAATADQAASGAVDATVAAGHDDTDLLLLQHSSGTTGLQKGVELTHGAVARHMAALGDDLAVRDDDVVVSWLPLYHDMGLISCFLGPLFWGIPVVWLSPFEWVANPSSQLAAVSDHRGTLMWLPNFAFAVLAQRARDVGDLSSLRAATNCSEPVRAADLDAFRERFAPHGLRPDALHASYALAENVFAVTSTVGARGPHTFHADRATFVDRHRAVPSTDESSVPFVSCGPPIEGCEIQIRADDEVRPAEPFDVGRIHIRSPFLFDGYYATDTPSLFDADGWFDTKDLGFLDDAGELYVTGRASDVVIVGGKNLYPNDVEAVVGQLAEVKPGRCVCFGVPVPALGTEGLVVLAETASGEPEGVPQAARRLVAQHLDLDLVDVKVAGPNELRKSTSGKIARSANRERYLSGGFGDLPPRLRPTGSS